MRRVARYTPVAALCVHRAPARLCFGSQRNAASSATEIHILSPQTHPIQTVVPPATPTSQPSSNGPRPLRTPPAYPVVASCADVGYDLEQLHAEAMVRNLRIVTTYPGDRKHSCSPSAKGLPPRMRRDERFKVIVLADPDECHIGVFTDGSIVAFGLTELDTAALREMLSFCAVQRDPMVAVHKEVTVTFRYLTRDMVPQLGFQLPEDDPDADGPTLPSFVDDGPLSAIVVESEVPQHKLPFMFCLAEMVQLKALESLVAPVAVNVSIWQEHVKATGGLPMSQTEARKLRARLLRLTSHLSKISAARNQIFWESECSVHRSIFRATFDHFELASLNDQLRERLESVGKSLGYLCEEVHANTHHRLEIVVIALIVVQVLIALADLH